MTCQRLALDMGRTMSGLFPNRGLSLRNLPRTTSKLVTRRAIAIPEEARVSFPLLAGVAASVALAATIALALVWYLDLSRPLTCQPSPLIFHIGSTAETEMTLRAGTQCPVYVLPGHAMLDEPAIMQAPLHGVVAPRGHVGVYYRPQAGFRGDDFFTVAINGKVAQKTGAMIIRVRVNVD